MKRVKPVNEHEEIDLPFSFLKKDVNAEKVKQHWERIKKEINLYKDG
jgi:hypothetical protein